MVVIHFTDLGILMMLLCPPFHITHFMQLIVGEVSIINMGSLTMILYKQVHHIEFMSFELNPFHQYWRFFPKCA